MTRDKISIDRAYELDNDWMNGTGTGLRCVTYRLAGNRTRSLLCIPDDDNALRYEYRRHDPETGEYAPAYYHVSGPTLGEWNSPHSRQAGLEALQAEYRDEADTLASLRQF